jgi:hypothetical protein
VTIDAELGPVESAPGDPWQPGNRRKRWTFILLGCLFGVFAALAVYDLVSISGGAGVSGGTAASGATSPAVTHPTAASPSGASPIAAVPPVSPSPGTGPAQRSLTVTGIAAFGPDGMSDGDHPEIASRALDDGGQPWYSSWYLSPAFGNLQAGTGLLLDMGQSVMVSSVQLTLGGQVGAAVQVRVGDTADLPDLPIVAAATDVGGTVRLPSASRARGRYVLIWFTALPSIGQGKYQVSVYNATVDGTAGT